MNIAKDCWSPFPSHKKTRFKLTSNLLHLSFRNCFPDNIMEAMFRSVSDVIALSETAERNFEWGEELVIQTQTSVSSSPDNFTTNVRKRSCFNAIFQKSGGV